MNKPLVCLLASADTTVSVLYGLYDVLGNVGPDYEDMIGGVFKDSMMDVRIVARSAEPFSCLSGIPIQPQASIDDIERADVVIVCDMYTPINQSPLGKYTPEVHWLKRMHARDALLCSVCSGATLLAETGLLDGHEVSSHWAYGNMFREYFPRVKMSPASILNLNAEHRRLVTLGGVTSWQDLALYLVERYCGLNQALNTARVYLLTTHDDGQSPFSAMTRNSRHEDAIVRECQSWIEKHYQQPNPVSEMVERSGLKARTFARRFRAATGFQPIDYVQGIRIEAAKELLESGTTNIEEIGNRVGYEDPASFRRVFKRKVGLTPAVYRRKFCSITARVR
ncbi:MAG TPA: helix-turn-helix domain-containing protein [Gammaproteobacteria bacterium]|nr:helix-turn-helix domain-containing protein [Gammaproteobacteria bacterium]